MTEQPSVKLIYCGELCTIDASKGSQIKRLTYFDTADVHANIKIGLSKFVKDISLLPARIIDLLEIAAYVFAADRLSDRGDRSSLNNKGWARTFEFHIPVRDYDFWSTTKAIPYISEALVFMTGDRKYQFHFEPYNTIPNVDPNHQLSMFTDEFQDISEAESTKIMLFSGGLDSLAGAIECLNASSNQKLCLVSHRSNTNVTSTQTIIAKHLQERYPGRIKHYYFECHFMNHTKSIEETQRTRMFLFSAIAFAICCCYSKHELYVYENGITSINLPKQADTFNARASRTTHPKTLALLQKGYQCFDEEFRIFAPYWNRTKADILEVLKKNQELDILSSTVSCSSTRSKPQNVQHCGCCSQCIDRRFAVYANDLQDYDALYENDFIRLIPDDESNQRLYNTLRLAAMEGIHCSYDFLAKFMNEIDDILDYIPGDNPDDKFNTIYRLFCRYGDSILSAAQQMRNQNDNIIEPVPKNSLLEMIANRDYLKPPTLVRVNQLDLLLRNSIRTCFQRQKPENEQDLNDKIQALLLSAGEFEREYPILRFANTAYQADHSEGDLLIEAKFIREKNPPSVAAGGIAKDITEVPNGYGLFFIVYDPQHKIISESQFVNDFEKKRKSCYVRIYD